MRTETIRPDVQKILDGLKPFQRDTVEYVFDRLYRDPDCSRRFLVADEVGLGKTLVARGVIAKAIDHMWDTIDRIDIVYICSNADIARQNINRLNITGQDDFAHASRLTLLPSTLKGFDHKLNFVSFTPGTSFDLKSSTGIQQERVLLYHLLHSGWKLPHIPTCNILQCGVGDHERWRETIRYSDPGDNLDASLVESYFNELEQCIAQEKQQNQPDIRSRFLDLCDRFARAHNYPPEDIRDRNKIIGELRAILAKTCLKALEPDLVIMDEFQRFKHLLTDDSDAGLLAKELFTYSDEDTDVRTILLSATPYKMYTLYEESGEDDHYQDFLATLEFLENNPVNTAHIKTLIEEYRREMYRFGNGDSNRLPLLKQELENALRRTMVRTERVATTPGQDDMLTEVAGQSLALQPAEIKAYLSLQNISGLLGQGDVIEYWKSAPYLLNFMDHYKLKEQFVNQAQQEFNSQFSATLRKSRDLFLSWQDIEAYRKVDPRNARLGKLIEQMLDSGGWRLLWTPPSLPYYKLAGPYADFEEKNFTKRLVFSSWTVVPKVLSSMLSYEVERRMFTSFEDNPLNTREERKRRQSNRLLDFTSSNDRLGGMPVLGLLYPSFSLACMGDPLCYFTNKRSEASEPLTTATLLADIEKQISQRLALLPEGEAATEREDEAWYWAAPIFLDLQEEREAAKDWLKQWGLPQLWSGSSKDIAEDDGDSGWAEHVEHAAKLLDSSSSQLGKRPHDLPTVLAKMALAGPAVSALRALCRISGGSQNYSNKTIRNEAGRIAWGFRKVFNQPEVMALIRGMNNDEPYWRRSLQYCVDGCLQAVLDEYTHILQEFLGVSNKTTDTAIREITDTVFSALSLKTASVDVDEVSVTNPSGKAEIMRRRLRSHFALRFGIQKSDDGSETTREDRVRDAFNSPFWPFVLASTSVGQEGLDFHPYCHALVHWNLPPNPVDMEQREGRIHRYKGHAVRKNLAKTYAQKLNRSFAADPWAEMFEMARQEHWEEGRGLVPFWSFSTPGGARIERHVPTLPLSRDLEKLHALRRSLVIYRMVFGQTRQEDMIEYLLSKIEDAEVIDISKKLQIHLGPPIYTP